MSLSEIDKLSEKIEKKMRKAAAELDFETAATLRDKLIDLREIKEKMKKEH